MVRARTVRAWPLAAMLLCLTAPSASASTSHYFYDAAGRYIGQTTEGTNNIRSNRYDAADNRTFWQLVTSAGRSSSQQISNNQCLFQSDSLVSANGVYTLSLQEDGNVVLYHGSNPIWSTNTGNTNAATFDMGGDGNLVLFDAQWNVLWSTNTSGNPGATFNVQTDGNLVIYTSGGTPIWASNTAGK